LHPPVWLNALQLPFHLQPLKVKKMLEKKIALTKTFRSYKIAYEELKQETGIVFLHLNKSDTLKHKLTILDNLSIAHQLDLDQMEFLVQKRADLFFPHFESTIQEKGLDGAKQIISDLVHFLTRRNQKGIFDKDPDIETNFAFLNDQIVQIDVGRFSLDPQRRNPDIYHEEIIRITDHFNLWLKQNYPSLSTHLEQEIAGLKKNA
jgi:hypothetical protein